MKKFAFSLEKVMRFKMQTLDVLKNELSILKQELAELDQKILKLNETFTEKNNLLALEMSLGMTANEICSYKIYLGSLNSNIAKLDGEKAKLNIKIAKKHTEIVIMNIEIGSLEKLKEKQYAEYRLAYSKSEELALNEFIGNSMTIR